MTTMAKRLTLVALGLGAGALPARAEWTLNLGYHNPIDATVGLNLLYFGKSWAFEAGLGWLDARSDKSTRTKDGKTEDKTTGGSVSAAGDLDIKYLFASGSVRPYIQAGFAIGLGVGAGSSSGAGAGTGTGFAGLGLMFGTPKLYAYGSYNLAQYQYQFAQAGIGFGL